MERREIGRTGLQVSTLGFGAGLLFGQHAMQAGRTVQAALDAGIDLFDCSPLQGMGLAEHRLGAALRETGSQALVSCRADTVLRPRAPGLPPPPGLRDSLPFEPEPGRDAAAILRAFEDSLQRLGRSRIDILGIGDPAPAPDRDAARFGALACGVLGRLRAEGRVGAIGLSFMDPALTLQAMAGHDLDLVLTRGYTLLDQSALPRLLPECSRRGISVIACNPFGGGILATRPRSGARHDGSEIPVEVLGRARLIDAVCRDFGVPLPAAALQFPLLHPAVISVVAGMASPEEAAQNAALMRHPVPAALWHRLRSEGLLHPDVPLVR